MNTQTAGYLVILGILVIFLGVIGYESHPEKAHTALISGGGFGALFILWGVLGARRARGSKPAALITAALLSAACVWRASLGWLAVASGQSEKVFASMIITLMLAVALLAMVLLLKDQKTGGVESPAGGSQ